MRKRGQSGEGEGAKKGRVEISCNSFSSFVGNIYFPDICL